MIDAPGPDQALSKASPSQAEALRLAGVEISAVIHLEAPGLGGAFGCEHQGQPRPGEKGVGSGAGLMWVYFLGFDPYGVKHGWEAWSGQAGVGILR